MKVEAKSSRQWIKLDFHSFLRDKHDGINTAQRDLHDRVFATVEELKDQQERGEALLL